MERLTCVLCGKEAPASRMYQTYSRSSQVSHPYCKDMAACDRRRGVTNSERAHKKAVA